MEMHRSPCGSIFILPPSPCVTVEVTLTTSFELEKSISTLIFDFTWSSNKFIISIILESSSWGDSYGK